MDYAHPIVKEFKAASEEVAYYIRLDQLETPGVRKRYKLALKNLRIYLDSLKLRMPAPKFPYEPQDKRTWKFLGVVVTGDHKIGRKYLRDVINPEWLYYCNN